ncbi:hypothetical protein BLA29_007051, partial [Euroglyphus maynei]
MQQMSTRPPPQTPTGGQQPMTPQQIQFIRQQQRWSQPDYNQQQQQQQYPRPQQQQAWIRQPIQPTQHRFPMQQPQHQQYVPPEQMIRMVTKPMPPNSSNQQQQQFYDPSSSLLMNNKVRANINHSPQQHQQDTAIAVQQSANSVIHNQQSPMVSIQAMNSPNSNSPMIQSPVPSSQQQSLVDNLPQSAIKTPMMVTNANSSSISSPNHYQPQQQQSSSPGTSSQVSVSISSSSSSSSSVVNEKTKTALANLLNNRLNSQLQQQNRNSNDTNPVTTVTTQSLASCGSTSSPSSPALHNQQNAKVTLQPVTVYSPNNNNVNNSGASNNVVRLSTINLINPLLHLCCESIVPLEKTEGDPFMNIFFGHKMPCII